MIKFGLIRIGSYSHKLGLLIHPLAFHLPQSFAKSIGWEPVASTNRTDTLAAGSEPEYDYVGDDWEE